MNDDDAKKLLSILGELRDGQKLHLERQLEALDLQRKQYGVFQEQAARAERLASSMLDTVTVERLLAFAADCRKQLEVLNEPNKAQSSLPQ